MIEISLLKAMLVKQNIEQYLHLLDPKRLTRESIQLLKDYQIYFSKNPEKKEISLPEFREFFLIAQHPNFDEKEVEVYNRVFENLAGECLESSVEQIIASFEQQELYTQLQKDLYDNVDIEAVSEKIEKARERINQFKGLSEAQDQEMSLTLALDTTDRSQGLQWRLKCLNEVVGPLIESDFIIFSAFVGKGKTSWLASESTHMAQQMKGDKQVLWFNNEGNWKKILSRLYCATLNCTEADLRKYPEKAQEAYIKKMNGDINRIKVIDIKGKSTKDIERIIKNHNPGLILIDMLDKVRGFEIYLKGESGTTERYNQLYAWAEQMADVAPLIATSQLNGDGCNEAYPQMTNLRGSRVDKQANAAAMIIMGALEGNQTERYLSTPKNKLSGNESWKSPVKFDPLRSRFMDI